MDQLLNRAISRSRHGFTLNELVVTILVLGVLAALALPQYFKSRERSDRRAAMAVLEAVYYAERAYFFEHHAYVDTWGALDLADPDTSTVNYTVSASGTGPAATFTATAINRATNRRLSITQGGLPLTGDWP